MKKFFVLLFCFFAYIVHAEEKIVKIAIGDFPPFEFFNNGKVEGINQKTVSDVLSRAGYKAEFYPLPWKRALSLVESGDMDALISIPKATDNQSLFIFSNPIMYTQYYLLKNKDLVIDPHNLNDIKNYNIGIIDKYFYNDKITNNSSLQLSPITSPTPDVDNLEKLSHNRLDLVVCSIHVCKYWQSKYSNLFSNLVYIDSLIIDDGHTLHVAFSKKDPVRSNEIVKKFNDELMKYIAEGNIEKNIAQYPEIDFSAKNLDKSIQQ